MADDRPSDSDNVDPSSELIDVSHLGFADVLGLAGSVIGESLGRILHELENPKEAVAGFQASI